MNYLSICAIFKQENPFLREWLEYYKNIDRFYLCCNDDDDTEAKAILAPYMDKITYFHKTGEGLQMNFYNEILKNNNDRWIAFIDLDEFIVNLHNLQPYEQYGGLALNMVCFSSNGLIEFPTSQKNQLTKRLPDFCGWPGHAFVKSIVNPQKVCMFDNQPHKPIYNDSFAVNTLHEIVPSHFTGPRVCDIMRINHYYTRSKKWWEVKMKRGHADYKFFDYYWHDFLAIEENANVIDNSLNIPEICAMIP